MANVAPHGQLQLVTLTFSLYHAHVLQAIKCTEQCVCMCVCVSMCVCLGISLCVFLQCVSMSMCVYVCACVFMVRECRRMWKCVRSMRSEK